MKKTIALFLSVTLVLSIMCTVNVFAEEQTNYLYITGSAGLCGKEWSESADLDSRMTFSYPNAEPGTVEEGRLEKTFKNVSAGTYEFKIYVINTRGKKFWINKGKTYTVEVEKDNSDVKIEYQSSVIEENDDEVKVTVIPPSAEQTTGTVEPTTETAEPTTVEPTTEKVEPTTVNTATQPQTTAAPAKDDKKTVKPAVKTNTIKVTVKAKSVKAKKLAKKAQKIKAITVKNAIGKVTYKLTSVPKKIKKLVKINKKGVITLAKGKYAQKTYKIKVKVTASGNKYYASKTIIATIKIKLK